MTNKTRNATLLGIASGLILIPIIRAIIRKYQTVPDNGDFQQVAPPNHLFAAYRGHFKPHRRKSHNGLKH